MIDNEELEKILIGPCRADVESGLYESLNEAMDGRTQDGDRELRRKLSKEELSRLVRPKDLGFVYFLLWFGTVVYVGKSEGWVASRICAHRKKGWQFTAVRVLPCPFTGYELQLEEQRFIGIFNPQYNRRKWNI